jgi:hypothetical protein
VTARPVATAAALLLAAALVPAALGTSAAPGSGAAVGRLPGAKAFKVCAAAGPYWPTETLAFTRSNAWLACKERGVVVKLDPRTGKVLRSVRLDGPAIAVAAGLGGVWALDSSGTLYRIDAGSGRIRARVDLGASAPYNVWIGAGSVWVADDGAGAVIRVSASRPRVTARIQVGDGPADLVFAGTTAWVVNHRDRGLVRLDTRSNRATRVATLQGDAPERMAFLNGSLWITGRGTDLLRVNPADGSVSSVADVGGSGIDVIAAGGALWVPARSAAVDPTGFPTMEALRRVSQAGQVTTVASARGRLDVHGLAVFGGAVWLADNTSGVLYRVPLKRS